MTPKQPPSSATYALRALVDLALHQPPVPLKAIAKRQGIPLRYLEQLFNRLRREKIVEAERGPRGGYRLNRKPSALPVSQVFDCLQESKRRPAPAVVGDPAAALWKQVQAAVQTTLEATTLQDLVEQAREQQPSPFNHPFTFHI